MVSTIARGANEALRVGVHSGALDNLGHPYTHILGESFSSIAPIRYGGYVAKIAVVPSSDNLRALTGRHIDESHGFNPLEEAVREFFKANAAAWEVQVQLALDSEATPIEDASKLWPEDQTAFQTVATLTVPPQESYSDAR